jgi:hypothetical protein
MQYKIVSNLTVFGKTNGDTVTEQELLEANVNVDALISAGHLQAFTKVSQAPKITKTFEPKIEEVIPTFEASDESQSITEGDK